MSGGSDRVRLLVRQADYSPLRSLAISPLRANIKGYQARGKECVAYTPAHVDARARKNTSTLI